MIGDRPNKFPIGIHQVEDGSMIHHTAAGSRNPLVVNGSAFRHAALYC